MADADALRDAGVPALPRPARPDARRRATSPGDETVMSLVDHLGELRTRLFRSILAVAVGSVVGFYFADPIIAFLVAPLPGDDPLQFLGLGRRLRRSSSRSRSSSASSWRCPSSCTSCGRSSRPG